MRRSAADRPGRVLLQSIDGALQYVTAADGISDDGAHEARRALKKARAALRLLRPRIGDVAYRRENDALRNASRLISPLRDAIAQLAVLAAVRVRYARRWPASGLSALEATLGARRDRVRRRSGSAGNARRAARMLRLSKRRSTRLTGKAVDVSDVRAGLQRIHKQGRSAFVAARDSTTSASLHEWRKHAKYLSNAVDVLGGAAGSKRTALAKYAECLADWLGEDHDLAVLSRTVKRNAPRLGARAAKRLESLIDDRRTRLQRKSLRLGADVYSRKAKRDVE